MCNTISNVYLQTLYKSVEQDLNPAVAGVPITRDKIIGLVVQLVRIPACHAGGRGFESRPDRKKLREIGAFLVLLCNVNPHTAKKLIIKSLIFFPIIGHLAIYGEKTGIAINSNCYNPSVN